MADRVELDKAIRDFTKAIHFDPKLEEAFADRGDAWRRKQEWSKALKDFDEAIAVNPKSVSGILTFGAWVRATCPDEKLRDGAKAIQDAKAAYEQLGVNPGFRLEVLAAAYAEAGRFDEAVKWQKKALEDAAYVKQMGKSVLDRLKLYEAKTPLRICRHRSLRNSRS